MKQTSEKLPLLLGSTKRGLSTSIFLAKSRAYRNKSQVCTGWPRHRSDLGICGATASLPNALDLPSTLPRLPPLRIHRGRTCQNSRLLSMTG